MKKSKRAEEKSKKSAEQALKLNQELEEKQQELQNALVEAQSANKAKTSFLNNMSHDIRTPINGIMGMLTILEKSGNDGERAKDCLNKINESSKLLLSLVNDVLDMAKLESDTVVFSDESINLDQVCQEITESLSFQAEEKGLHVMGEHDDYRGVYVWSNAVHLKKVLMLSLIHILRKKWFRILIELFLGRMCTLRISLIQHGARFLRLAIL